MLFPEIPSLNFPEMWCLKEICFDHYTCLITKMILEKKKRIWDKVIIILTISPCNLCIIAQARVQAQETRSVQNGSTPSNQGSASPNTRLMRMVQQVKEVLPQVPSPSIARDLSKLVVCNRYQSCPVLIKGTKGAL